MVQDSDWLPAVGFEDYEINREGYVRRRSPASGTRSGAFKKWTYVDKRGRHFLLLRKDGLVHYVCAEELAALTFGYEPEPRRPQREPKVKRKRGRPPLTEEVLAERAEQKRLAALSRVSRGLRRGMGAITPTGAGPARTIGDGGVREEGPRLKWLTGLRGAGIMRRLFMSARG